MIDTKICDRFRSHRKKYWNNMENMARDLGISTRHISDVETGKMEPTTEDIKLLILKTNLNPNWLLFGIDPETNDPELPKKAKVDLTTLVATVEALQAKVKSLEKTIASMRKKSL